MIDIEYEVFDRLAKTLRARHDPIYIYGEYQPVSAKFPVVTVEEKDNHVVESTQSSLGIENHAGVMYEINVYSNLKTGKKSQVKRIFKDINEVMSSLGFTRLTLMSVPNLQDATIYRMVGRYRAVVSKDKMIYRR